RPEIDQNPAAVRIPLGARDAEAVLPGRFGDRVGNRAGLDLRAPGDHHERIGNDGAAGQIEDRDVLAFFLFGGGADDVDEFRQSVSPAWEWVRSGRRPPTFAARARAYARGDRPALR